VIAALGKPAMKGKEQPRDEKSMSVEEQITAMGT